MSPHPGTAATPVGHGAAAAACRRHRLRSRTHRRPCGNGCDAAQAEEVEAATIVTTTRTTVTVTATTRPAAAADSAMPAAAAKLVARTSLVPTVVMAHPLRSRISRARSPAGARLSPRKKLMRGVLVLAPRQIPRIRKLRHHQMDCRRRSAACTCRPRKWLRLRLHLRPTRRLPQPHRALARVAARSKSANAYDSRPRPPRRRQPNGAIAAPPHVPPRRRRGRRAGTNGTTTAAIATATAAVTVDETQVVEREVEREVPPMQKAVALTTTGVQSLPLPPPLAACRIQVTTKARDCTALALGRQRTLLGQTAEVTVAQPQPASCLRGHSIV